MCSERIAKEDEGENSDNTMRVRVKAASEPAEVGIAQSIRLSKSASGWRWAAPSPPGNIRNANESALSQGLDCTAPVNMDIRIVPFGEPRECIPVIVLRGIMDRANCPLSRFREE